MVKRYETGVGETEIKYFMSHTLASALRYLFAGSIISPKLLVRRAAR